MRLSVQMKKILLTLLKAELDPQFFEGKVKVWRKRDPEMLAKFATGEISSEEFDKRSVAQMTKDGLIMIIKPSAVTVRQLPNKRLVYIRGSVDLSFSRSLRRLVELGLIEVLKEVSHGSHGSFTAYQKRERQKPTK